MENLKSLSTRRQVLSLFASAAVLAAGWPGRSHAATAAEPPMGDDGLYKQPWFFESFLELPEDLQQTSRDGKRLAILWEQRGCPYCHALHKNNFSDAAVTDYIRANFNVIQLNLWGSREVIDFDGEKLNEKTFARKYRINFTPTLQFFPETVGEMAGKQGEAREVARLPGYFRNFHFVAMFEFVREKLYTRMAFQDYIREKGERRHGGAQKPGN
jgi:thioredoxin-related protein